MHNLYSPRLIALRQALPDDPTGVLAAFWSQMKREGTPLIEPLAGDEIHALATFLWRATGSHDNVMLVCDAVGGTDFPVRPMQRLGNTDLWYLTLKVRRDLRTIYGFAPDCALAHERSVEVWDTFWATAGEERYVLDPLNPRCFNGDGSLLELPVALPEPWARRAPDVPAGELTHYHVSSGVLSHDFDVWTYTPPGYAMGQGGYRWLLLFDGRAYLDAPVTGILDNLVHQGYVPPLVAVFVEHPNRATRQLELTGSTRFNRFLTDELLPFLETHLRLSSNPAHAIIGGSSQGGLAGAYAAMHHPNLFGNVLAQGGYFCGARSGFPTDDPTGYGWLASDVAAIDRLPLRFHLDVGTLDTFHPYNPAANPLVAVRHLRDVLLARGYPHSYIEFSGGHDFAGWRAVFPDALMFLANG